ncbi:MAG TPA: TetR-like C-terminal domain-containing protein, partial [Anaerolineae bacterium]|nr:TetR-like C-terminal domain-containing protein [Anaerolineae bacterium]
DGLLHDLTLWGLQKLLANIRQAVRGKVGREALLAVAQAYRDFAHTQPGIYPLTLHAHDPQDAEWTALSNELIGTLQLILASYGFSGEAALHAIRGWRSLLHGFVSLEMAGGFGLPLERDESFGLLLEIYLDGMEKRWG